MKRRLVLALPVVLFLAFCAPVQAQLTAWPVPRGPSHEPAPYTYDPAILKTVPHAFIDDASACVLYSGTSHLIQADGTVETITHEITRLGSRKGIDTLGEYQAITFNPSFETLTLNEARIHKKRGGIVQIEPRHVQLRDVGTDFQVYNPDKQFVISFPNLEVGDVYEVKWTVRGKNPEFGDNFFARYNFGDDRQPVVRDELHVVLPKDKPFHYATINGKVNLKVTDRGPASVDRQDSSPPSTNAGPRSTVHGPRSTVHDPRFTHYYWWVTNKPALPQDDEKPSLEDFRLQVAFSTYANWDAVGRWKNQLRAECWKCTPGLQKVIADVAGPQKTPLEKARALTYWVRRQVRYVSRGPGGLGYTPNLPEQVLANRYGDCKDQAQLLAVMLKQLGLPVYLVTLGPVDDGQVLPDVPAPWGTHAILLVKIDGQDHWIDTTVSHAGWDYLPRGDRNRQVYVTRAAEVQLLRTPGFSCKDQRIDQVSDVVVTGDGTANIRRQVSYQGGAALNRRDAWVETPSGERRRLLVQELQDSFTRTRHVSLKIDDKNLLDFDRPVTAHMDFQVPHHFSGDEVMEGSFTDAVIWNRFLAYNVDPERTLPLKLPGPFVSVHKYRVFLPLAFRFDSLPRAQVVKSRWGRFKLDVRAGSVSDGPRTLDVRAGSVSDGPRTLEFVMEMRLENDRVEPKDFTEYQTFHDEVARAYRAWITFKPTRDPADIPLLATLLTLAPGCDLLTEQTLARLYLDQDRTEDARRMLDTALIYHPRDVILWDLRIRACADPAEEEQTYRKLVGLFPRAPRYRQALGEVLDRQDRHADARLVLEPLTKDQKGRVRARACCQLARSFYATQEYEASLKQLEAAVAADSATTDPAEVQQFLARVHAKLGHTDAAAAAYRRAMSAEPDSRPILRDFIRFKLSAQKGDADRLADKETLDLVRRFTLLAGKEAVPLVEAAEFHYQLGRLEDAFELAGRSRDLAFNSRSQRLLGLIHLRHGEYSQAILHLDRAEPDAEITLGLIRAHLALGQLQLAASVATGASDQAASTSADLDRLRDQVKELMRRRDDILHKATFSDAREAAGTHAIEAFVCAEFAYRQGEPAGRVHALLKWALEDESVAIGPPYALRALLLLEQGKIGLALSDADRAIAAGPAAGRAYLVRGRVRLQRGQSAAALADLTEANRLSEGKDALILHWLATAQFQRGQLEKALETQRRAVQLRPGDQELLAQLHEFEREKK